MNISKKIDELYIQLQFIEVTMKQNISIAKIQLLHIKDELKNPPRPPTKDINSSKDKVKGVK